MAVLPGMEYAGLHSNHQHIAQLDQGGFEVLSGFILKALNKVSPSGKSLGPHNLISARGS
jgi:hypothetical protein